MRDNQTTYNLKRRYRKALWNAAREIGDSADVVHLAAVLRMFLPEIDLAALKPMETRRRHRGRTDARWYRLALDVLRAVPEPLTAHQIAQRVAFMIGKSDVFAIRSVAVCLYTTLDRLDCVVRIDGRPRRWTVRARVEGSPKRWTVHDPFRASRARPVLP